MRLTAAHREQLLALMIEHRFDKERDKITKEFAQLAEDLYEDAYGPAVVKQMNALPEGWLLKKAYIRVSIAGSFAELYFSGETFHNGNTSVEKRQPHKFAGGYGCPPVKVYDADHVLAVRYAELSNRRKEFSENRNQTRELLKAALAKVSTSQALLEQWPESEPFLKKLIPTEKVFLPAIPTARLNELLKLPVAKEKADEPRA